MSENSKAQQVPKMLIELTYREALVLSKYLSGIIAKGSISTSPSWARKILTKIENTRKHTSKETYD
jgi:hypothetical protein